MTTEELALEIFRDKLAAAKYTVTKKTAVAMSILCFDIAESFTKEQELRKARNSYKEKEIVWNGIPVVSSNKEYFALLGGASVFDHQLLDIMNEKYYDNCPLAGAISCIKRIREVKQNGLKEAKEYYDTIFKPKLIIKSNGAMAMIVHGK